MRKCQYCGKEVYHIYLVRACEFETMQVCEDCLDADDEIVNEVEGE